MLYRTVTNYNEGALDKLTSADPAELGGIAIRSRLGQGGMGASPPTVSALP